MIQLKKYSSIFVDCLLGYDVVSSRMLWQPSAKKMCVECGAEGNELHVKKRTQ